jgi:peptidoglycan/xylan/chitin deacetylase (PgdA/CDA1 family)
MTLGALAVPILMYHSIGTSANDLFRPFTITPERFEAHLELIAELGYRTRTVHDLVSGPVPPTSERTLVLTFDDGFLDFATDALPRLLHHGCTGTVYVPTEYVGRSSRWLRREGEHQRPLMGWDELDALTQAGIECGAHSHTHPQLDLIDRSSSQIEIRRPREMLEDRLGAQVTTFAYPFGYFNRSVAKQVRDAGYTAACAVRDLPVSAHSQQRFAIPRLTVKNTTGVQELRALLDSTTTPFARFSSWSRSVASRELRRVRVKKRGETS